MSEKRRLRAVLDALRSCLPLYLFSAAYAATAYMLFKLYGVDPEVLTYHTLLVSAALAVYTAVRCCVSVRRGEQRRQELQLLRSGSAPAPISRTLEESDWQAELVRLRDETARLSCELRRERTDMIDYYTAWVHQIKTPISVIRMTVADDDTPEHRAVLGELFRIEQYVDMVMQYVRLDSDGNDLVIAEYSLDPILRASFRRFAPQFVMKHPALTTAVRN